MEAAVWLKKVWSLENCQKHAVENHLGIWYTLPKHLGLGSFKFFQVKIVILSHSVFTERQTDCQIHYRVTHLMS